jgi:hypothetical protein
VGPGTGDAAAADAGVRGADVEPWEGMCGVGGGIEVRTSRHKCVGHGEEVDGPGKAVRKGETCNKDLPLCESCGVGLVASTQAKPL